MSKRLPVRHVGEEGILSRNNSTGEDPGVGKLPEVIRGWRLGQVVRKPSVPC